MANNQQLAWQAILPHGMSYMHTSQRAGAPVTKADLDRLNDSKMSKQVQACTSMSLATKEVGCRTYGMVLLQACY